MYMRSILTLIIITPLLLTGCATPRIQDDDQIEITGGPPIGTQNNDNTNDSTNPMSTAMRERLELQPSSISKTEKSNKITDPLSIRVILFNFDSSTIRPDATEVLLAHSRHLTANTTIHITLEGHGDERGTREYNLALGERRAQAAKQFLMDNGVADEQLQILSYGEEKPADPKANEQAWAKNRRVELLY